MNWVDEKVKISTCYIYDDEKENSLFNCSSENWKEPWNLRNNLKQVMIGLNSWKIRCKGSKIKVLI